MRASRASLPSLVLAVVVVVASGCRVDLPASPPAPARLDGIEPARGRVGVELAVTLRGAGFTPRVTQDLGAADGVRVDDTFEVWLGEHPLREVRFEDAETLQAKVPADLPAGRYSVVVITPYDERLTLEDAYEAFEDDRTPSSLSGAFVSPARVTTAQSVSVDLVVTNAGEASALGVVPDEPALTTTGAASATLVEAPASQDVPGGGSATFTWRYQVGDGAGTLAFTAEAAGSDEITGEPTSTGAVTSEAIEVQGPPLLAGTLSLPEVLSTGQAFEVTLFVENTGEATAASVQPGALTPTATGGVTATLVSAPAALDVPPGAPVVFTWTYTASGPLTSEVATLSFSGEAEGVDANSGAPVGTGTFESNVANVGAFSVTLSAPAVVSVGQTFSVTMALANDGGAALTDVQPSTLSQDPDGAATLVSAPAAPFPMLAASGGEAELTWSYVAATAGSFTFAGTASGTDADSGATVTSPSAVSNVIVVEEPPSFGLVWTTPASVTRGQTFDVTLLVTNAGEADALGLSPGTLAIGGGTGTTCGDASPAVVDLAGGASATFAWTCTAGDVSGAATLAVGVSGSDENAGTTVTAAPESSDAVQVERAPVLGLAWTLPDGDVSYGQGFSLALDVTNAGEASATVTASAVTVTGTTGTSCQAALPVEQAVPGGDTVRFTFACTAGGTSGSATFEASASGADDNSGEAVSVAPLLSAPVVVESPPALRVEWGALPARVSFAGAFDADLTVFNDGEARAVDVAPAGFVVTGSGTTCTGPIPASAAVDPASQQTFRYACTVAAPASAAVLSAGASGSDENAAVAVSAPSADSAEVLVGSVAVLDLTLVSAADATVYRRQRGARVELHVENLGEAAADVESASEWLAFSAGGVDVSGEYVVVPAATNPTSVAGGDTAVFAFDVEVGAAATLGEVTLDGAVDGSDALDGTLTSDAGATTTDRWTVAINEPPVACFVSDLNAREVARAFTLDASCSSDLEHAAGLTVEWDFENDGTFDTAPSTTRTATHAFAAEGVYTVVLRVSDPIGSTSYASHTLAVAAAGRLRLVTTTNPTGAGSFTEAVAAANAALGPDVIAFDPAVFTGPSTVLLNAGQSPVLTDGGTRIVGHAGVRLDAARGFVLSSNDNLLAYLSITGSTNGECIDVDGSGNRVIDTVIDNCEASGLRVDGDDNLIGPGNVFPGNYGDDIAIELGGAGNVVDGSRFLACADACVDFLFGASGARVQRNVIDGVVGDGIVLRGINHDVHHNTLHGITGTAVDADGGFGHSVRSNVFSSVLGGAVCGDVDADFNDLFNVTPSGCDTAHGPSTLTDDPRFVDAAAGDFRLAPTSPLIDRGDAALGVDTNGAAPGLYDGAAPDVGAYEHNPG